MQSDVSNVLGIFCSSQTRRTSSIGKDCTEQEHCVLTFDAQTGDCPGPGNQCKPGWMGPGCQYGECILFRYNTHIYIYSNK